MARCGRGVLVAALVLANACTGAGAGAERDLDVASVFPSIGLALEDADASQRSFAEQVADCMREHGFRYEVHVARSPRFDGRGDRASLSWPQDGTEWVDHAREYGYGYVANQRLLDIDSRAREIWLERHPDPNQQYADGQPPARRDAYFTALYGPRAPDAGEDPEHPWPPADPTAGCLGQAISSSNPLTAVPEELARELADLEQRVEADEEVARAQEAWSACMAARGYQAGAVSQFRFEVQHEVLGLLQAAGTRGQETVTVDVGGDTFEVTVPRWDPATVERAQRHEVEIAVADAECDLDSGYGQRRAALRLRLQQEFVERHRAILLEITGAVG